MNSMTTGPIDPRHNKINCPWNPDLKWECMQAIIEPNAKTGD